MSGTVAPGFMTALSPAAIRGSRSLFRQYQDAFLREVGPGFVADVVELGGERQHEHRRFFPNAASYTLTNVDRDFDVWLDIADMPYEDASQSVFVCASVLEHVEHLDAAIEEIRRTLAPGGVLIGTVPFLFPIHDVVDYRRFGPSFFGSLTNDFDVTLTHLGGRLSAVANLLQRPPGSWNRRHSAYKILAFVVSALGRWDQLDDSPLGFGFVLTRRHDAPVGER